MSINKQWDLEDMINDITNPPSDSIECIVELSRKMANGTVTEEEEERFWDYINKLHEY